jgi:hypothetical protein
MIHETKREDYNFNIWDETNDPVFSDINRKSRVPEKWLTYQKVCDGKYKDSILKPINKYVEALYPPPKLISIENNKITLRQGNHAEFFLLEKENKTFFNLDRPWMRQYYKTEYSPTLPLDCFPGTYKFYVPWYVDANVLVSYVPVTIYSPFFTYYGVSSHQVIPEDTKYLEPDFVAFHFKSEGSHIDRPGFGKIPRQSPMFDIVFEFDDIILKRIKEFYGTN